MSERHDRLEILSRLRVARREFHAKLKNTDGACERLFTPANLLGVLCEHVSQCTTGTHGERYTKLFALAVLLYSALDWHFPHGEIDVEADVQLERIRQGHRFGWIIDDRRSAQTWQTRLREQLLRLEQQLACESAYIDRLVKITALTQAALEAMCRKPAI